jgi:hypothetical protein
MQMAATAPVLEGEEDFRAGAEIRQLERRDAFSIRANPSLHPQLGGLSFVDAHLILQFRCRSPMSGRVWRWHANLTALIPYRL